MVPIVNDVVLCTSEFKRVDLMLHDLMETKTKGHKEILGGVGHVYDLD